MLWDNPNAYIYGGGFTALYVFQRLGKFNDFN